MPQMNPMNWLLLLLYFNLILSGVMIKIHYLMKNLSLGGSHSSSGGELFFKFSLEI